MKATKLRMQQEFEKLIRCIRETSRELQIDFVKVLSIIPKKYSQRYEELYTALKIDAPQRKLYPRSKKLTVKGTDGTDEGSKELVRNVVRAFSARVTGIRDGELLFGGSIKRSRGIVWRYSGPTIPVAREIIDTIRRYPEDLWPQFLRKLNSIPFFEGMTNFQKDLWFHRNSTTTKEPYVSTVHKLNFGGSGFDVDVSDVPRGSFYDLGKITGNKTELNKFAELPQEFLNEILAQGDGIPLQRIEDMFMELKMASGDSSKGLKGHATLIFLPSSWKIISTHTYSSSPPPALETSGSNVVVDVDKGKILTSASSLLNDDDESSYITYKSLKGVVFKVPEVSIDDSDSILDTLLEELVASHSSLHDTSDLENEITKFEKCMSATFTPAGYKSLLQKIIRFRPRYVNFDGDKLLEKGLIPVPDGDAVGLESFVLPADIALVKCFIDLYRHPGSLVPDIQTFVKGDVSAMKRLVVSIVEDGYFLPKTESSDIISLISDAFLLSRIPEYSSSEIILAKAVRCCVSALNSNTCYRYNISKGKEFDVGIDKFVLGSTLSTSDSVEESGGAWQYLAFMINELKSMPGDHGMIRWIAECKSKASNRSEYEDLGRSQRPRFMPIYHCIDHHWATDVAMYFEKSYIENINLTQTLVAEKSGGSLPFVGLFNKIFWECTGVNSRRTMTRWKGEDRCLRYPTPSKGGDADEIFENKEFIQLLRSAQSLAFLSRNSNSRRGSRERGGVRDNENDTPVVQTFREKLGLEWIAASIGDIYTKLGSKEYITTFSPGNFFSLTTIHVPKRDDSKTKKKDASDISESEKRRVEAIVIDTLISEGYPINQKILGSQFTKVKKIKLVVDDIGDSVIAEFGPNELYDVFYQSQIENVVGVMKNGEVKSIVSLLDFDEEYTNFSMTMEIPEIDLSILQDFPEILYTLDLYSDLPTTQQYIHNSAFSILETVLKNTSESVLGRLLKIMSGFSRKLEIPRISRNGNGQDEVVIVEDVTCFKICVLLCTLFPSTFARRKVAVFFDVKNYLQYKRIVKCIRKEYDSRYSLVSSSRSSPGQWVDLDDVPSGPSGWNIDRIVDRERTMKGHQVAMVEEMMRSRERGMKGHFVSATVGLGKTKTALEYIRIQLLEGLDPSFPNVSPPKYIIFSTPKGAMKTIEEECKMYNFQVNILVPLKDKKRRNVVIRPYTVNLIQHDHLRLMDPLDFFRVAGESFVVMDEVHKAMYDTSQRTNAAKTLVSLSKEFILLTGTPAIDNNIYRITGWLKQAVLYEITEKNQWGAINSMISKTLTTGIETIEISHELDVSEMSDVYFDLIPVSKGGRNATASQADTMQAVKLCLAVCYIHMSILAVKKVREEGRSGVFLVARTKEDQVLLRNLLIENHSIPETDIFLIGNAQYNTPRVNSINLTPSAVSKGLVHDYKYVITTVNVAEGYTLTTLDTFISSVYPSNAATRTQLRGRIDRLGQPAPNLEYITMHVGLLSDIYKYHLDARNLEEILRNLSDKIGIEEL